ncbi:hypothetical protein B0H14DRAFT_162985 [Mycena olivaceomarginata]|nr:hypothetical protein B0H14DRAFT_162985 [Mycena olivaceomarginata]
MMPAANLSSSPLLESYNDERDSERKRTAGFAFRQSATAVRAYADQFEASYARPALKTSSAFFDEHPISSTFIVIFSSLAFFPVITFIALSLFTIVSLSFVALCCAFVVSSAVVLFFLSILVLSLVTAFFASGFFTVLALSTYLAYRFVPSRGREEAREYLHGL